MALRRASSTLNWKHLLQFRKFSNEVNKLVSLKLDSKTGFATLEMNRPPVNSLNLELLEDIKSSLVECEKQKCRGLILTSTSDTVFCAGLDIMEMYKPKPERLRNFWITLQDVWIQLYGSSYPTVAAINGHAPAGGCLLSISCEYRIMRKNYTIGLNETALGLVAPFWFMNTMQSTIGQRETELALTLGRLFTTDEAFKVGLVDEVVENKEEALSKAEAFLAKFSKISPMARIATKQNLRSEAIQKLVKKRDDDLNLFVNTVSNEKIQKSLEGYMEMLRKKKGD